MAKAKKPQKSPSASAHDSSEAFEEASQEYIPCPNNLSRLNPPSSFSSYVSEVSFGLQEPEKDHGTKATGLGVKRSEEMKRSAKASRFITEKRAKTTKKPKSKQKKKNDKFDVNKPKKPPTAFFYFLDDFRKEFQEQNPDVKSMRDVGKACGEKWKTMTYEEKVQYYDIATEKRAEFDKAMAEYKKRKESGVDQESEEDWEIDG